MPRIGKFIAAESRLVVTWAWGIAGGRMGSYCLMGTVFAWGDEKFLQTDGGDSCAML